MRYQSSNEEIVVDKIKNWFRRHDTIPGSVDLQFLRQDKNVEKKRGDTKVGF